MTPETLTALRTLLFFTRQEAAQWVAASPDRPRGVSYRAWKQWEDGDRPIPEDVAANILALCEWRSRALDATEQQIAAMRAGLPPGVTPDIRLCWYNHPDDFCSLPGRNPVYWRPHQSVLAEMAARHGAILTLFWVVEYDGWLARTGKPDSELMRAEWAATETES